MCSDLATLPWRQEGVARNSRGGGASRGAHDLGSVSQHELQSEVSKQNVSKMLLCRGAWVAQWIKCLTSAQVMILRFMGSSPMLGSVLTAQSLEPALGSVSPTLFAPSLLMLPLSLKKIK